MLYAPPELPKINGTRNAQTTVYNLTSLGGTAGNEYDWSTIESKHTQEHDCL